MSSLPEAPAAAAGVTGQYLHPAPQHAATGGHDGGADGHMVFPQMRW